MATRAAHHRHRHAIDQRGRWLWLGLAAVVLVGGVAVLVGRIASNRGPQNSRPDLQRVIDGLVTGPARIAPGVTAYVAGPRGVWVGSAGIARIGTPMKPDARLRLNSVGKTWTATLILKLVAEGRMKLGGTVSHWLPGLLPYGNRITIEQLLSMTSGMLDTNDFETRGAYWIGRINDPALRARIPAIARRARRDPTYPPARVWIEIAAAEPLLFRPGSAWHYSNLGYKVLGLVAARVGGADLATLFRMQIIDPLHLQSARYDPAPDISGPHAHGYSLATGGKLIDATRWTGGLAAEGGIVSDAADEARFLRALMRGHVLRPAQLMALETPYAHGSYGLGIAIQQDGCSASALTYGHNGAGDGYMSSVQVSPQGDRVAVVLVNAGSAAQNDGSAKLFTTMQRLYCAG